METWLGEILGEINSYSNLISAASTVAIAFFTIFLWRENRRLRQVGETPDVVAYILPHEDGSGAVNFILANIGRGPAFDVNYQFVYNEDDFRAHKALLYNDADRMPIAVLPQGEEMRCLFGISFELYGNVGSLNLEPLKPFEVRIRYKDSLGRDSERNRLINIKQFAGLRGVLSKSNDRKAVEALDKIEGHLGRLSKQVGRFDAFVDITEMKDRFVQKTVGNPDASDQGDEKNS